MLSGKKILSNLIYWVLVWTRPYRRKILCAPLINDIVNTSRYRYVKNTPNTMINTWNMCLMTSECALYIKIICIILYVYLRVRCVWRCYRRFILHSMCTYTEALFYTIYIYMDRYVYLQWKYLHVYIKWMNPMPPTKSYVRAVPGSYFSRKYYT